MTGRKRMMALLGALVMVFSNGAQAAIVSVAGNATQASPGPLNISEGQVESNTVVTVFDELQDVVLGADLAVDITAAGLVDAAGDLTPGNISAGTVVDSHMVHFDKIGSTTLPVSRSGSVTVDGEILGIIVTLANLTASDTVLGLVGATFEANALRELELTNQDTVTLSANLRTVSFSFDTSTNVDNLRIISTLVPEPTSAALGLMGLGTLMLRRKRRRG